MPNPENVRPHQFKKGQSGNPNGRPRKFVTAWTEQGYKRSEINDTIQAMMALTMVELKDVFESPDATVFEKTVAGAIRKGIEKGSMYTAELLLSRVYGQPKQDIETTITVEQPLFADTEPDIELLTEAERELMK
jgi:hypothetical protein